VKLHSFLQTFVEGISMSTSMQGAWTVSVKSKSASLPQRFLIVGAGTGNGIYAGDVSTTPVNVTGANWFIQVQANAGQGFVDSKDRIKFPLKSGGMIRFDIETNDPGADQDFDDLILTCSTVDSPLEFVVYGSVTAYSGFCLFNPCARQWVVIDHPPALIAALKDPVLRVPIEKLYPQRVLFPPLRLPPGPQPDPAPFMPMVIPLTGNSLLPPKLGQVIEARQAANAPPAKAASAGNERAFSAVRTVAIAPAPPTAVEFDRVAVAKVFDFFGRSCQSEPVSGYGVRFEEYDRSTAELAGGPYDGSGNRDTLGVAVTDMNGNYVFRFSRLISDFVNDALLDTASGETATVQMLPDVIAQLLDATAPTGVSYESAPRWNVGNLTRMNICVPASQVRTPSGCLTGKVLEKIGNIRLLPGLTTFDSEGRVTSTDTSVGLSSLPNCAAWGGTLRFSACFLNTDGDPNNVAYYTIRHRHRVGSGPWSEPDFYREELKLGRLTGPLLKKTGPFPRNLAVDPPALSLADAYDNVESDNAWFPSDWFQKALIDTTLGTYGGPGTVELCIQGYDAAGHQVPGKSDSVTLYIDNEAPFLAIGSVKLGAQPGGDCELFHLGGEPTPALLTVQWQAAHPRGFLGNYALTVQKCGKDFPIALDSGAALSGGYTPGQAPCDQVPGTVGLVTSVIKPAGEWLMAPPGETFSIFTVLVGATKRVTNGEGSSVSGFGPAQRVFAIQP
jgi:hypothetical protein